MQAGGRSKFRAAVGGLTKTGRRMPDANIRRCASRRASARGANALELFGVEPKWAWVRGRSGCGRMTILGPPGHARAFGVEFDVTQSGGPVG